MTDLKVEIKDMSTTNAEIKDDCENLFFVGGKWTKGKWIGKEFVVNQAFAASVKAEAEQAKILDNATRVFDTG